MGLRFLFYLILEGIFMPKMTIQLVILLIINWHLSTGILTGMASYPCPNTIWKGVNLQTYRALLWAVIFGKKNSFSVLFEMFCYTIPYEYSAYFRLIW